MTKFSSMIENLKARQEAMASEGAFSLIDVVVTVAIVVALSVGGFIAYSGIVDNAKKAATAAAADQVYTSALVAENDGFAGTTGFTSNADSITALVNDYNASTTDITVAVQGTGSALEVVAWHKDAAAAKGSGTIAAAATPAAKATAAFAVTGDPLVITRG